MKLLIVTPTLGRSIHLKDTLASIERLTCDFLYVIVGPEHASGVVAAVLSASMIPSNNWIYVNESQNCGGLYPAINHAINSVTDFNWDYFTYINDDDILGADFDLSIKTLSSLQQPSFCYGNVILINENGEKLSSVTLESNPLNFLPLLKQGISPLNQQGMLVPRIIWNKLASFETKYRLCADLDFWLRAYIDGFPFHYNNLEVGGFRVRSGQLSGDTAKMTAEINCVFDNLVKNQFSPVVLFFSRWSFRVKNFSIYFFRLISGVNLRGMSILNTK